MQNDDFPNKEIISQYTISRKFDCCVCFGEFHNKVARTQKMRFIAADDDLHQVYNPIDPLLYDVIICPRCGYAAMSMYFNKVSPKQRQAILKERSIGHIAREWSDFITYKEAIARYELAYLTAFIKGAKHGELGYINTKLAWLYRLSHNPDNYKTYADYALNDFKQAYENEDFPICNMEQPTFEYLLAYFCYLTERREDAQKWLGRVITNNAASGRIKDKARDLRDKIKGS